MKRTWGVRPAPAEQMMEASFAPEEAFWHGLIDFERRQPLPSDLKLDRMRALLHLLGDPHTNLRIVHIAGSKGKGSTSTLLAAVLRNAGYRTALFTSPHLVDVRERFQVDGQPIAREELLAALREIQHVVTRRPLPGLTFFEVATAVGFLHFRRRRCDAVVLEVGLGGRFDSTNVCLPAVSIITSISFDHTRILGDRLSLIAGEKAGIVKPGRPCVSGVTVAEPREVIEAVCRLRRAPLQQLGVDFHCTSEPGQVSEGRLPTVTVTTHRRRWPTLNLNLLGRHQAANAAVAIAAIEVLREQGWHIPDAAVAAGLAQVEWPARLEIVGRVPWIVLDCAHNVASAEALVQTLEESFPRGRSSLVFASSADKDVPGIFRVLAPHFQSAYLTRYTNNPRAVAPEALLSWWSEAGGSDGCSFEQPQAAVEAARASADRSDDLICITGSVFLAGELRPSLLEVRRNM